MKTSHKSTRQGFTLMELLVVIALMGVVTTMGVKAFSGILSKWREATIMAELENSADSIFEEIAGDLSDVLSADLSGISIVGIDDEWKDSKEHQKAPNQSDSIIIPIQDARNTDSARNAASIQYSLEHGDTTEGKRKSALIRAYKALGSDTTTHSLDVIDGTDTLVFDIQYASDAGWVNEWSESTLPKAIRVGIVVAKRNQPYYQISRKAVFAVAVQ